MVLIRKNNHVHSTSNICIGIPKQPCVFFNNPMQLIKQLVKQTDALFFYDWKLGTKIVKQIQVFSRDSMKN